MRHVRIAVFRVTMYFHFLVNKCCCCPEKLLEGAILKIGCITSLGAVPYCSDFFDPLVIGNFTY